MKTGVYLKLLPYTGLYRLQGSLGEDGASSELVQSAQDSTSSSGQAQTVT